MREGGGGGGGGHSHKPPSQRNDMKTAKGKILFGKESGRGWLIIALSPGPLFIFCFERAWYICENTSCYCTSLWTSVGVSMEMPPFTMTSFQSAYGRPSSSLVRVQTDGRIDS